MEKEKKKEYIDKAEKIYQEALESKEFRYALDALHYMYNLEIEQASSSN